MLRMVIPFLGGVICWILFPALRSGTCVLILSVILLTGIVTICAIIRELPYRYRWAPGMMVTVALFLYGVLTAGSDHAYSGGRQTAAADTAGTLIAEILEPPAIGRGTVRLITAINRLDCETRTLEKQGNCLLVIARESLAEQLRYGDWLICSVQLHPIAGASNPGGFDPSKYYLSRGVSLQGRVDMTGWARLTCRKSWSLLGLALNIRDHLMDIFRQNGMTGETLGVASALLLGESSGIGRDLKQAYSATGTMHILSVSGMHVGVIYLSLSFILGFLHRTRTGVVIRSALIIIILWIYAFLTGLSPPVFRAALMLSLVVGAQVMKRRPELLNVLASSLLIMLVADPDLLRDIGFQFSYLAVTGIACFYQPIFNRIRPSGWLASRIWSLIAVSVAAQLATFPLGLYAFHQFPNYFIPVNLLIIPLSSLIIYTGIWVLFTGAIPVICLYSTHIFSILIETLNTIVRFADGLPGVATTGVFLSIPATLSLYIVVVCVFLWLTRKKKTYLCWFLGSVILFESCSLLVQIRNRNQLLLAVLQLKDATLVEFVDGRRSVSFREFRAPGNEPMAEEILQVFRDSRGIRSTISAELSRQAGDTVTPVRWSPGLQQLGGYFRFYGIRIGIIGPGTTIPDDRKIPLDMVILRGNPETDLASVARIFSPSRIIADASNNRGSSRNWKRESDATGISFHTVTEQGAIVLDLAAFIEAAHIP